MTVDEAELFARPTDSLPEKAEVLSRRQGGSARKSYLDNDGTTLLEGEVESGYFGTTKDVRDYIETQCGLRYTMPGVYS